MLSAGKIAEQHYLYFRCISIARVRSLAVVPSGVSIFGCHRTAAASSAACCCTAASCAAWCSDSISSERTNSGTANHSAKALATDFQLVDGCCLIRCIRRCIRTIIVGRSHASWAGHFSYRFKACKSERRSVTLCVSHFLCRGCSR